MDGGQGDVVDPRRPKQHMAMIRRAVKDGWPITPQLRRILVDEMADVMALAMSSRDKVAAAKVLIAADVVNTRREAMDQKDDHHADGDRVVHEHAITVNDRRSRLDSIAERLGADRLVIDAASRPADGSAESTEKPSDGNGEGNDESV